MAYEQCKNELQIAQEKIEYLQNVEFREYTEQITDLKHMLLVKNQESPSLKSHFNSKRDNIPSKEEINNKATRSHVSTHRNSRHEGPF